MNRIVAIDPEARTARVQPGVVSTPCATPPARTA